METKKKVLVAEDDAILRGILVAKLNQSGYEAQEAEDGIVALDSLRKEAYDLLILDMMMPHKGGMDVLEEMHADPKLQSVPVIVVSNSGQPVEIERAQTLGARDFLIKAVFDPSEVLEKAQKVLSGPVTTAQPATGAPTPTPAPAPTAAPVSESTILVVEDDKFLRELLIEKLLSSGFKVLGAVDGKEGVAALEKTLPDLLVLDIILPDINGFEILTKIRGDKRLQNLPVIILSNLDQKEDLDRAIALGVSSFMVKSNFSLGEIVTKVKKVLEETKK